ncbi:hypothetical protein V6Z11_D10G156300, partial [Gossypium hirsutum]
KSTLLQLQHHLYYALNFTFSSKLDLWDPNTRCCSWKGVTSQALGHVIGIDLSYQNLSGNLHSIFNLHHLQRLNLARNNFNTTLFQYGFGKLPNLTHLNLSASCFHGKIPEGISYLTSKSSQWCETTSLSLPKLSVLSMSDCGLIGPFYLEFQILHLLICQGTSFLDQYLHLYLLFQHCEPYLLDITALQRLLDLSNMSLLIGSHKKSRTFPQLETLQLSSCNLIEFPKFIKSQNKLTSLDLSNNRFHGLVPNWLWKSTLGVLDLSSNAIDIPNQFPFEDVNSSFPMLIQSLQYLDLSNNNISGAVPNWAWKKILQYLDLSNNKLEGKLPRSLANCTMLYFLNLGNNTLTIHFLCAKVTQNQRNNLEGKLPRSLANCRNLAVLDLGKNMIHDTFPYWLVKLSLLKVLILRSNRFYGSIKIFGDGNAFPMLHILDLASNNFSGEISVEFFQSLRGMMVIDDNKAKPIYVGDNYYYQDSVTIVNRGFKIFYQKILTLLTCLDLSNNNFHGRILDEVQDLKYLHVLNLSYNGFFGPIPSALGSLTELESLDLSQNSLSGKIPPQLTSPTFLAVLNLSYNPLDGSIPQSNQFGTFLNDSYRGNPRLCGVPLTKKCNEVDLQMLPPKEGVLMGYGCGLVLRFSIGYTVLNEFGNKWMASLIRNWNRKWRRSR